MIAHMSIYMSHSCMDDAAIKTMTNALPSEQVINRICQIFGALQCTTRLQILLLLQHGPLCVTDLEKVLGQSQSAISHNLRTLRQLDLVRTKREGRFTLYHLADEHVSVLIDMCQQHAKEMEN